jgi:hypothetical protein
LDESTFTKYVALDEIFGRNRRTISIQALSNIIRINLLAKFGGVWVDAMCFCCQPLQEWVGEHLTSGFFAFEKPGTDRLLPSWFLAPAENCHLTQAYRRAVNTYWSRNQFSYQRKLLVQKKPSTRPPNSSTATRA